MRTLLFPGFIFLVLFVSTASATTFEVTNLGDAGPGSLRQAVVDSNTAPGADVISFQAGLSGVIELVTALPELAGDLTINGPGPDTLTVRRNSSTAFRIFTISTGTTVVINGLTLRNGSAPQIQNQKYTSATGGGILNEGQLTVNSCKIIGNSSIASFAIGGGISNQNVLTVNDSELSGNLVSTLAGCPTCHARGGGIHNSGTAQIVKSMVSGTEGVPNVLIFGAIYNDVSGTMTITSSNIINNSTPGIFNLATLDIIGSTVANNRELTGFISSTGGIYSSNSLSIVNSTISGNSGAFGGVFAQSGTLRIVGSTITNNVGGGLVPAINTLMHGSIVASNSPFDLSSSSRPFDTASSFNLIGIGTGNYPVNGVNGNIVGTPQSPIDPLLSSLGAFGGNTLTHKPLPASPVINAGNFISFTGADQRGVQRPVGSREDIGSVEFNLTPHRYLPNGAVDLAYNQTLTAYARAPNAQFEFSLTSGELPPGLTLSQTSDRTAVIYGTPTATGVFGFTITAANADGFTIGSVYSVTIQPSNSVSFVYVGGQVVTAGGLPVRNAFVQMCDANGNVLRASPANPFGYYRFVGVQTNETYTFKLRHKTKRAMPRTITVAGPITNLDLIVD